MELKIYSQSGNLKLTVSTSSSSTWNQELMTENALSASWVHPEYVPLDVNDYVLLEGVKFSIKKEYKPKQKNKQTYNYSVKFYAPIHDAEQVMYLNLTDGQYEPQFSLDGSPREHLQKWVDNMNRIYGEERWLIGDVIEAPNQTIEYSNTKCWDSLGSMAEAFATEWWSDGFYINLCRCERGERVELGYMQGLTSLTQTENSDDVKFFTRLLPLGSTKNIDRSRYGFSRLQLPNRAKYVDRNTNYGLYEHVESEAFAGIFPHYTGTVTSVRTEEKIGEDKKPFTVYFFKDSGMAFDPSAKENEIGGLVKHVSFQTGDLAGRDFEANYNSTTKEWEIINTYPDEDRQIPGGNLIPAVGNKYIPWNFRMPVEYEKQAEQDYKVAVNNFLAKYSEDIAKYGGESDYTHIDRNAVPLVLGQSVRLLSDKYFPDIGHRDSRMTKVVRKLDNLSIATIECTNQVGKGWKKTVDDSVRNLQYVVGETLNQAMIDVLKSWDGREPSEYNVFSALASIKEITTRSLSRIKPDTAQELITFLKGLLIGENGSGFVSLQDGTSQLVVDRLYVKIKAIFDELEVKKKTYVGGEQILTPAGMKCIRVEELPDAWRCYFKAEEDGVEIENTFTVGQLAISQENNIKVGVSQHVGNRYYWREVTAVGVDYIDLSKTICDPNIENDIPAAGDDIVGLGHATDITRQGAIVLSSVNEVAPSILMYQGINDFSLAGKDVIGFDFDKATGKARMRVYGDAYIGAKDRSSYIEYTQEGLESKGKFISIATGKGYDDMFDEMHTDIDKVKTQTDKEYVLWFFDYEPSLSNIPAVEWDTEELKSNHEHDMFYNSASGFAYRFELNVDGFYSWNSITDQQTVKALENASKAQDTADGKRRGFVSQPTDAQAYDVGDIWTNATYPSTAPYTYEDDTLVCKTSKSKGEAFDISHWKPSVKYTSAKIKNLGDKIEAVVERFNDDGSLKDTSGLVVTADFANLFSQAVYKNGLVKRADISTFITQDQAGNLISNATIQADKINFLGKTTINGNFIVDIVGNVTMNNATVTGTIIANNGKIGGFKISGNGLTNANDDGKFTNDAYIIFRNDPHGCFAGIGGNILPATSGLRGVARFENHDKNDWWGLGSNYAMLVSAQGAGDNCAISFGGGFMSRVAFKIQTINSATTISRDAVCVELINTSNITVNLPDMEVYDDGHVIIVKRMGSGAVRLITGYGKQINGQRTRNTFSSTPLLEKNVGDGEALRLIYSRGLSNYSGYSGCWIYF